MNLDKNPSEIENELKKLGYWDNLYTKNDYFGIGQTILANFAKDIIEKNSIKISIKHSIVDHIGKVIIPIIDI